MTDTHPAGHESGRWDWLPVYGHKNGERKIKKETKKTLTGYEAIEMARKKSSVRLNKYADPTEDARWDLAIIEAEDIADEDPSLIWCEI
jgi:hypothetical protein